MSIREWFYVIIMCNSIAILASLLIAAIEIWK
jgi:hypothetical protein